MKGACAAALGIALIAFFAPPAHARTRLVRTLTAADGLPTDHVQALGQDPDGFLWIGTAGGLVRYDGRRMEPWGTDRLDIRVEAISISPSGAVVLQDYTGRAWEVTDVGVQPLSVPEGVEPGTPVAAVAYSLDGSLWLVADGLWRQDEGRWSSYELPTDQVQALVRAQDGVLVVSRDGVWKASSAGPSEQLSAVAWPKTALEHDGAVHILGWGGAIHTVRDGQSTTRESARDGRALSIAVRGDVLWVAQDRSLTAHRPDRPTEVLTSAEGVPSGGPLLVDEEGSLWLGTFNGLLQFPEPETVAWTEADGLPSNHGRMVIEQGDQLRVSSWQGHGRLDPRTGEATTDGPWEAKGRLCADGSGGVWGAAILEADGEEETALIRDVGGVVMAYPYPGLTTHAEGCASSEAGTVWLATRAGIFEASTGPPKRMGELPSEIGRPRGDLQVLEDSSGQLWVGEASTVCRTATADLRAGEAAWSCEPLPANDGWLLDLVEANNGSIWGASWLGGIWRYQDGWSEVPMPDAVPTRRLNRLVAAQGDGLWVLSLGSVVRVSAIPQPTLIEQLDPWDGVPPGTAEDLVELQDGSIWVLGNFGLMRLTHTDPSTVPPPRVRLVEATSGGARLPLDASPRLADADADLQLRFSALSFRAPGRLRYRSRTSPTGDWSRPTESPEWSFAKLSAGRHFLEVGASLDGERWSTAPAIYRFSVPPPWYGDPRLIALVLLSLAALVFGGYRVRIRMLLGDERVRTTIAMDLHDEVGAGLGSIGLLTEVLDGDLEDEARQQISSTISQTAEELGRSLSAIVWSLRPGSTRLDRLADLLAERSSRMFPGVGARVELMFPDPVPSTALSLPALRAVQCIALEAMHNAARHSGAENVTLELAPQGGRWRLRIADDGVGLEGQSARGHGSGTGLSAMQKRADAIGADLRCESGESGTTVTLIFPLQ